MEGESLSVITKNESCVYVFSIVIRNPDVGGGMIVLRIMRIFFVMTIP